MSVLPVGFGGGTSGIDTGDIPASLRFRSAASAYLSRTFGTPTNQRKFTVSLWVKRGALSGSAMNLFGATSGGHKFGFDSSNALYFSNSCVVTTSRVFRDPTSHIHILYIFDSAQATAADRVKLYVNGVQETAFSTASYPALNDTGNMNAATVHSTGSYGASEYLDGYLSRVCFVDGQALTPSSFGYLNTDINEWVSKTQSEVKAVVDAGGANSFMLDFDDATSLTTLGYDKSSNGNHWTLNGHSLTAGVTYDHTIDVAGNSFATLNPLDNGTSGNTLSDGNLKIVTGTSGYGGCRGTQFVSSGKWYWEITITSVGSGVAVGIWGANTVIGTNNCGATSDSYAYLSNGDKQNNNSNAAYGATYTTNDVIGIALDMDAGTLVFYKNNSSQGTAYSSLSGSFSVGTGDLSSGGTCTLNLNFGQAPLSSGATYHPAAGGSFKYEPPTGFLALCQANLETPAILNPREHFDVKTWAGNSSTQTIATEFPPNLIWTKSRGDAAGHSLLDVLRGTGTLLNSAATDAESSGHNGISSFSGNSLNLSADNTGTYAGRVNETGRNYVGWLWKAGGAGVSNTDGSITSTVSANVEAGFSIVTYTGTGANATVGHGLGVAPKMIVIKERNNAGQWWQVGHQSADSTWQKVLYLNTTDAISAASPTFWNNTAPTSTVFTLGTNVQCNRSTGTYVAYCFAEIPGYSKIGSYVGNGSADGPFVHCGFKPRFILLKGTTSASLDQWMIWDTARNTYNVATNSLQPNSSGVENTSRIIDVTSSGFKPRENDAKQNLNGETYIFYAIADVSAKYSLSR